MGELRPTTQTLHVNRLHIAQVNSLSQFKPGPYLLILELSLPPWSASNTNHQEVEKITLFRKCILVLTHVAHRTCDLDLFSE